MTEERRDIVIAGGGMTGLACAAALKQAWPALRIAICDPALARPETGNRASAIAAGPRRMLAQLGIWDEMEDRAQPMRETIVTDSRVNDVVRPRWLTFDGLVQGSTEPVAHMVMNADVTQALRKRCASLGVELSAAAVEDLSTDARAAHLTCTGGARVRASLVVIADGARSALREKMGVSTVGWAYDQAGIVATVGHTRDHEGRAWEHFLPAGPFAILPLRRPEGDALHRSSIVWNETREHAAHLLSLPRAEFMDELERRFGNEHGEISLLDEPRSFPFGFHLARAYNGTRFALIGDAAHLVHPIAGQGLNLGLRDVAALAQAVVDALRLGFDAGNAGALAAYEEARRFETWRLASGMDVLNRLFANDSQALRLARDLGLGIVDRLPGLKGAFSKEAGGIGAGAARLLRGEPI